MAMSIGKNFGKLKQWTSEKLGSADKTEVNEDFKTLLDETDNRNDTLQKIEIHVDLYLKNLGKRKVTAEDKTKTMPIEALAHVMINQAGLIGEGTNYGKALLKVGTAHEKIANIQLDYVNKVRAGYYNNLDKSLSDLKDFYKLKAKLENRRLDLDAKLSQMQKAKKEKPELEEAVRSAQNKYDDSLADTFNRMIMINEAEELQVRDLATFVESELNYYVKCTEILTPLLSTIKELSNNPRPKRTYSLAPTSESYSSSYSNRYREGDDNTAHTPDSMDDERSNYFERREVSRSKSISSNTSRSNSKPPLPPPLAPRKKVKQMRCLYGFSSNDSEELSMEPGDLVTVIEEVDEGWWIGEIKEGRTKRVGMFPVNYTEPVTVAAQASTSTRSESFHSNSSASQDPWNPNKPDPFDEPQEIEYSSARKVTTPTRKPIPVMMADSDSESRPGFRRSMSSNSVPPPRPSGPKPTGTVRSSVASGTASPNRIGVQPPVGLVGRSNSSNSYPNDDGEDACRECGCNDFRANPFKRGSCNNCFHKH